MKQFAKNFYNNFIIIIYLLYSLFIYSVAEFQRGQSAALMSHDIHPGLIFALTSAVSWRKVIPLSVLKAL